jgi:hypothetical protein
MPTVFIEQSLRALQDTLAVWFRDPELSRAPRDTAAEEIAQQWSRLGEDGLRSAISEHITRVAEYADRLEIDSGPLREFLRTWSQDSKDVLFALVERISEHVRSDPDTIVCEAMKNCLMLVESLRTYAPRGQTERPDGIDVEAMKSEEAQESFQLLSACLQPLAETPRRKEWAHLEVWAFLEGVLQVIRRVAGPNDPWPTVWGRLRKELLEWEPPPDFAHLRGEVKANLARLRGEGQPLPAFPSLSEQPSPSLDPEIQDILDRARAKQGQVIAIQRAHADAEARLDRAYNAWLRVCQFRGNAIPRGLTGEALYRRYAELIVDLGRVLKADGWQDCVEAVRADTEPKVYALTMLRKAMEEDTATVTVMVREGISTLFHLGFKADSWLREGLMYEVLNIEPDSGDDPEPPLGWEGPYLEAVETVDDFVKWIDGEFRIQEMVQLAGGRPTSDGRLVRNAFRLVMKLELKGMPLEPQGPVTLNDELAVLRNLRRLCLERQGSNSSAAHADGNAGQAGGAAADKAEATPVLPASVFTPEKLDPSRCPGCQTPVSEEFSTLPRVVCLACRRWELHTGLLVMPVAGPEGTPPKVVRHSSPFWQPTPPNREGGKAANNGGQDALPRLEGSGEDVRGKRKSRTRGRPRDTDPKADQRIFDAWQSGQHKTYADLATALGKSKREVEAAIDRHRKRTKPKG